MRPGFDPGVGKIPWRRERLPTPVFWPGELHGLCRPRLSDFQLHSLIPWWVTTSPAAAPGAGQRAGQRAGLCVLAPRGAAWVWPASSQGQLPRQPRAPPHPPGAFHLLMIPESLQGLARLETQAPDRRSRGGGRHPTHPNNKRPGRAREQGTPGPGDRSLRGKRTCPKLPGRTATQEQRRP